jgi:hypothetical protein
MLCQSVAREEIEEMGTLFLTLQNASMPRQTRLDASGAFHHIVGKSAPA